MRYATRPTKFIKHFCLVGGPAAILGLFGCSDLNGPGSSERPVPASMMAANNTTTGTAPIRIDPRFDLDLRIDGSLKPGHRIHVTVEGRANFATSDGEVRLILPEIAFAQRSGWDVVEMPVNEEVPPLIQVRRSFAAGERFTIHTAVVVPEAGYYSIAAIALQHSDDRASDGERLVGRGAASELWLWVDETGGKITQTFEPAIFPDGVRRIPGPRGSELKPPRLHDHGGYHITCTLIPGEEIVVMSACPGTGGTGSPAVPPGPDATATLTVTYKDLGTGVLRPLPDALIAWKVINTTTNVAVANGYANTSTSGESPVIDCKGPTSERRLEATIHTRNNRAEVKSYLTSNPDRTLVAQFFGACGGSIPVTADNHQAHLFINMNKNWEGHARVFGAGPPTILRAGLYPPSTYGTRYNWDAGDVRIEPANFDHIWLEFGNFVAAHEWGHLWQDQYLYQAPATNGLRRFYFCPHDHYPWLATSLGCATAEAFADWYAVLIRESDLPTWRRDLEENTQHLLKCLQNCGDDGSIVQGAVSAFLWDITDGTTEGFDRVQKRPIDVVASIKGCEVSTDWIEYRAFTGIDHLIWCMEHRYPYQVRIQTPYGERLTDFFNTRSKPWPINSHGFMVDGFSDDFRRIWLVDLYSKRENIGQTPIFRTILASEDPSIEQPTEPDPTTCTQTGTGITCSSF